MAAGPALRAIEHWSRHSRDGAAERRLKRYVLGFGVTSIALPVCLVLARPDSVTLEQAVLAAMVTTLGLVPTLLYLLDGARWPLPLLPLNGIFYSVAFGLTAFSPELNWFMVPPEPITKALQLTVLGLLVLYGAYFLSGHILFGRMRPVRLKQEAPLPRLRVLAWLFFAAHLTYQFLPSLRDVPSIGHLLYPLGWLAIGLLFLQHLHGRLPWFHRVLFFGAALPLELLSRWITGALYEVFVVFVFMFLIYWQARRRIPWTPLLVTVSLLVLLNPVKFEYRKQVVRRAQEDTSALEKANWFAQAVVDHYLDPRSTPEPTRILASSLNRVSHIPLFAYAVETSPGMVPYWGGETYKFFLASVVPRFLWPDKPVASVGNEFGRRYHLLYAGNYTTAVNLPWLPEFYVNYGTWGVVVGMALVGIGFRFLVQILSNPTASHTEYVLGLTLIFQLFYAESNLALMWGGLFLTFIALYTILRFASQRFSW